MNRNGFLMLLGFCILCLSIYIESVDVLYRVLITASSFVIFLIGVILENYEELERQRGSSS